MRTEPLSTIELEEFRTNGVLVLRNFYDCHNDIKPIQLGIYEIIGEVIDQNNLKIDRPAFEPETFDSGFIDLIRLNRSLGSIIYDAVKQLPSFYRLIANPAHEQLFRIIRPGSMPGVAGGGSGIRIDNPGEDKFRAMWHQEYPAQLRSLDGIVFWSPLISVEPDLGPVEFCLGSHKAGPVPVVTSHGEGGARSGAYALKLKDEEKLIHSYAHAAPLTAPGDLVIIDFLTLHASGHNRGHRSRWSMQFRYFNYREPTGRRHGWVGSFASGINFRTLHPELCADEPAKEPT